jgi:hypothetical protein
MCYRTTCEKCGKNTWAGKLVMYVVFYNFLIEYD